jgi:hypothetical protein
VRPADLGPGGSDEPADASGVIGVVMRQQDTGQPQFVPLQCAQDRAGVSGVDHGAFVTTRGNQPDIIIGKCRYRCDSQFRHIRFHWAPGACAHVRAEGKFYHRMGADYRRQGTLIHDSR